MGNFDTIVRNSLGLSNVSSGQNIKFVETLWSRWDTLHFPCEQCILPPYGSQETIFTPEMYIAMDYHGKSLRDTCNWQIIQEN